jgi:hypothetical protein
MKTIPYGGPREIPAAIERTGADEFENAIRKVGVVFACEWFGYPADSGFVTDTIKCLRDRSAAHGDAA